MNLYFGCVQSQGTKGVHYCVLWDTFRTAGAKERGFTTFLDTYRIDSAKEGGSPRAINIKQKYLGRFGVLVVVDMAPPIGCRSEVRCCCPA
jgi:hypothetical protein